MSNFIEDLLWSLAFFGLLAVCHEIFFYYGLLS